MVWGSALKRFVLLQFLFLCFVNVPGAFVYAQDVHYAWSKVFGGTSVISMNSFAVDSSGRIYTTGQFEGTADFAPGPKVFSVPIGDG